MAVLSERFCADLSSSWRGTHAVTVATWNWHDRAILLWRGPPLSQLFVPRLPHHNDAGLDITKYNDGTGATDILMVRSIPYGCDVSGSFSSTMAIVRTGSKNAATVVLRQSPV